jgi:hypothetical protein
MKEIDNNNLTIEYIDAVLANDEMALNWFALSFNGYTYEKENKISISDLANSIEKTYYETNAIGERFTLSELRACLFLEQRRHHHWGYGPDKEALKYWLALIEAMKKKLVLNS